MTETAEVTTKDSPNVIPKDETKEHATEITKTGDATNTAEAVKSEGTSSENPEITETEETKEEAEAKVRAEAQRKAAHARNTLTQHADRGHGVEIKGDMVGWMNSADTLVKGLAPHHSGKLWRGYPSGSDPDEILSAGEIDSLQRSIASLHVIVGAISESDYA